MNRLLLAAAFAGAALAPAGAVVTAELSGNVLTVTSDTDADTIAITVASGNVLVNGADPSTGPTAASLVNVLTVNAGGGGDTIDLSAIDATSGFPAFASFNLNGQGGPDIIVGSQRPDIIEGGQGQDTVDGGAGDDTLVWRPGHGDDDLDGGADRDSLTIHATAATDPAILLDTVTGTTIRLRSQGPPFEVSTAAACEDISYNDSTTDDTLVVGDLAGTGVQRLLFNLDGGSDTINASGFGGEVNGSITPDPATLQYTGKPGAQHAIQIFDYGTAPRSRTVSAEGGFMTIAPVPAGAFFVKTRDAAATILHLEGTLDDTVAVAEMDDAGSGQFSLFCNDGNDTVTTVPQVANRQDLRGGGGTDTLVVDLLGLPGADTGSEVLASGRIEIRHSDFETVDLQNEGSAGDVWSVSGQ